MTLKIELGRRETLAANSPGWELAESSLELRQGSEGRTEVCAESSPVPALPLCSSGLSFLPSSHWGDLKK